MKTKLFALLYALCLCVGLVGCTENDAEGDPSNNPSQESTDETQDTSDLTDSTDNSSDPADGPDDSNDPIDGADDSNDPTDGTDDTSKPQVEKEQLTEDEVTDLTKIIGEIAPLDYLGRSVKTSEITNEEILRIGLYIFNPRNSGFDATNSNLVVTSKAKKYFGIENVTLDPSITCSCGQTIATYNSEKDWYCWSVEDTHYLEHTAEAYNELIEAYKLEDLYYVELYKIFPDLMKNTTSDQMNFYATYADSEKQENALFSAANETEFTTALDALTDAEKTKYTYIFKLDDSGKNFILQEYMIGE